MKQKYGCAEYRQEMVLVGLKNQLKNVENDAEKDELKKEIARLELQLFGGDEKK